MNKEELMEIRIHKKWNSPQGLIVQHLIFDELIKIDKRKGFITLTAHNKKTGFKIELKLYSATIMALSNES